jgi:hypothetical protein
MINTTGGIDKLIEQKANAYRENPQALQKRYSQNQELMDLLAMQKLKYEKETAARDMALNAAKTPGTIAEQYEQQLVSMNKNEMANQVAGVLGQKQKQAQQRQQAMGITPQQRPQQRPQGAPQGIANQPRPNMQGMAQGGIVGYQKGGDVSRLEKALEALGMTLQEYKFLPPREKDALQQYIDQEYVKQRKDFELPEMPIVEEFKRRGEATKAKEAEAEEAVGRRIDALKPSDLQVAQEEKVAALQSGIGATLPTAPTGAPATGIATTGAPATGAPATTATGAPATGDADKNAAMFAAMQGTQPGTAGGIAGQSGQMGDSDLKSGINNILGATADLSQIDKNQVTGSSSQMDYLKARRDVSPEAKEADARRRLTGDFNLPELDAEYKALLEERKAYERQQSDPETVKAGQRQAYIDNLITGGDYMSATAGRSRFDASRKADRERFMKERAALFGEYNDKRVAVVTGINEEAGKVLGRYLEDASKAAATIATMEAQDIAMYQQEADRLMRANNSEIANRLAAVKLELDGNLQKLIQQQASANQIASEITAAGEVLRKQRVDFLTAYEMTRQANAQTINNPKSTPEQIQKAIDANKGVEAIWSAMEEKSKLTESMDKMLELLGAVSGQNSGGGSSTTTTKKGNNYLGSVLQKYGVGNTPL